MSDLHELIALVQEGIDATRLALVPLLKGLPRGEIARAVAIAQTKIDEAELWLGKALEVSLQEIE